MGKSSHFIGQPMLGQLLKLIDKSKILEISLENGGEGYAIAEQRTACQAKLGVIIL